MARDLMPCLWFQSEALEAAEHYCAIVPGSHVDAVTRGPDGQVILANFTLAGKPVMALNGNPNPGFVDASSMVLSCEGQAELDHVWDGLLQGGAAKACGWLADRYGVAWQIVPDNLPQLLDPSDPEAAARVMQAVWQMIRIDIATLEEARQGGGTQ
ncbi:VOC family protein [Sandaracinobacter sp. RS1-74]|uniref:VOC family protein n=1 Tax=Sandaracinobacteroides sayramensis TaxID=2913411 RepID=UPI001EDB8CD9|nr:VOC family protein [Sandaracinobacteroides sayramensis]MCG2842496.1 VOC family protein [Sandaracinobacteroides sayramensis]